MTLVTKKVIMVQQVFKNISVFGENINKYSNNYDKNKGTALDENESQI